MSKYSDNPSFNDEDSNAHLEPKTTSDSNKARWSDQNMSLAELKEALNDKSHPRHKEAVELNKELIERLRPALNSLKALTDKTVDFSNVFKKLKLPTVDLSGITKLQNQLKTNIPINSPTINPDVSKTAMIEPFNYEPFELPDYSNTFEAIQTQSQINNDRAAAQLEVLSGMAAMIRQLNTNIEILSTIAKEGNAGSGRWGMWAVIIGSLTLIATIVGILV